MSLKKEIGCELKLLKENESKFSKEFVKGYRQSLKWVLERIQSKSEKENK